jgi:hypothetical protein
MRRWLSTSMLRCRRLGNATRTWEKPVAEEYDYSSTPSRLTADWVKLEW